MANTIGDHEVKEMVHYLTIKETEDNSRGTVQIQYCNLDYKSKLCCSGKSYDFGIDNSFASVKKETEEEKRQKRIQEEQEFRRLADLQNERKMKYLFTHGNNTQVSPTQTSQPKHRCYRKEELRKNSFGNWKSDCTLPTWIFAICGFFHRGFADLVECYYCGLSRKGWLHNDDPIVFHMQMKPQCKEVVTLIGRGISSCRDLYYVSEQCTNNATGKTSSSSNHRIGRPSTATSRFKCKVCLVNPLEVTIQPCGHFAMCDSCCQRILRENRHCPVCRCVIQDVIKTFMPE